MDDPRDEPPPWDLDHEPSARTLAPTAPPPAEGVAWAEFPLRAGALLIDLAVAGVVLDVVGRAVSWLFNDVVFATFLQEPTTELRSQVAAAAILVAPVGLSWILIGGASVYLWRVYRATPGQMALGLFTVDVHGLRLTTGAATTRFIVLALAWLVGAATSTVSGVVMIFSPWEDRRQPELIVAAALVLPMLWYALLAITILRDPRGRGLHDRVAGSVVVRRAGPPS